jgi:hypothetical protein
MDPLDKIIAEHDAAMAPINAEIAASQAKKTAQKKEENKEPKNDAAADATKKQKPIYAADFTKGYINAPEGLALSGQGKEIEFTHIPTGKSVSFLGFITEFSDAYTSNWERTPVYGRSDEIQAFRNTSRSISLGWSVPAASAGEAFRNLSKVQKLVQFLYPVYERIPGVTTGARSIKAPPLLTMRFANLVGHGQHAGGLMVTLDGLDVQFDQEAGFHFGQDWAEDEDANMVLPKVINLACTAHVMHTHPMGFESQQNSLGIASLEAATEGFPYQANPGDEGAYDFGDGGFAGGFAEAPRQIVHANMIQALLNLDKNGEGGPTFAEKLKTAFTSPYVYNPKDGG